MTNPFTDTSEPLSEPPGPPLSIWCPVCGAYLMTLGLAGPWECEMCGAGIEEVDGAAVPGGGE